MNTPVPIPHNRVCPGVRVPDRIVPHSSPSHSSHCAGEGGLQQCPCPKDTVTQHHPPAWTIQVVVQHGRKSPERCTELSQDGHADTTLRHSRAVFLRRLAGPWMSLCWVPLLPHSCLSAIRRHGPPTEREVSFQLPLGVPQINLVNKQN